ncbi:MAG: hypothetical protein F2842_04455 [Actinobacteria bacterium]|nr:hypothetical protein [Actinomycetota bacterium]
MHLLHRHVCSLVALVAVAALAACGNSGSSYDVPPASGTCWNYSGDDVKNDSYTGTPVACDQQHTVETVVTLLVPEYLAAKGATDPAVIQWVKQRCQPEVNRNAEIPDPDIAAPTTRTWLGYFTPSAEGWTKQSWVSCAAVSVQPDITDGRVAAPVTGSVRGTAGAGAQPLTRTTPAGASVTWRTRGLIALTPEEPYPGEAVVQTRSTALCTRTLQREPAFMTTPTLDDWAAGGSSVGCYVAATG